VCVSIRGWMGKTTHISTFERGMVVSRTATLLGFSWSTVSHVYHPKDIQHTWHNCGQHWSQHGSASLRNAFDTL
jgi:hypothetical protein